ncbi:transcription factor bHLH18-like [Iris pallida]|uniref:Transcription factor bHLH18-like n=1 Tax=Iris pallida TaxID=29817 RepID=A0AAX6DYZ1_IRIPA|nr:transcription factor bHLH18-like [Iris pallida]KAJ6847110.1 transcription factor bHLH18-like [Iris pallida]
MLTMCDRREGMDDGSSTNQWEFSSLYHCFTSSQQMLTDFQPPPLSSEDDLIFSSMVSPPMSFIKNQSNFQRDSSWTSLISTQQAPPDSVPEAEISVGALDSREGLKWNFEDYRDKKGCKGADSGFRQLHAKEHIMAERKRREKLSQRFIALAALIPGLKKTDKATVLGDAIKYVKELEGVVKSLEEKKAKKAVESAVFIQKCKSSTSNIESYGSPSSSNNSNNNDNEKSEKLDLPEVEVRLSEKTILVRIHCENRKGVLVRVLSEIENYHLMITNTSAVPFSESFLDITVTALMEEGFSLTVKELVKKINLAYSQFI